MEGSSATGIVGALSTVADNMTSTIDEVLPIALGVAGVVLVATIAYRLFKKFSKG